MPGYFIRLNYMGHVVFKASKPPVRAKQAARDFGEKPNQADLYNRSSLALEFAPEAAPMESHLPHLVSIPNTARTGVPDSPLWRGQDPFASAAGRGSRNVSMIIHIIVISGIVWWS